MKKVELNAIDKAEIRSMFRAAAQVRTWADNQRELRAPVTKQEPSKFGTVLGELLFSVR